MSRFLEDIISYTYNNNIEISREELGALDINWYEEYRHLYKDNPVAQPHVKRVFLKNNDGEEIGFLHLRPLKITSPYDHRQELYDISEFYVSPPAGLLDSERYFVKCLFDFTAYGYQVTCTPYLMPNPYFGVCGESAAWICLKILNYRSGGVVPEISLPEIQKSVTGHSFIVREGMEFRNLALLLRACNSNPFIYNRLKTPDEFEELYNIVYAYIESSFPVIIGIDVSNAHWWEGQEGYHVVVVIGHTLDESTGVDGFIIHDESKYPYIEVSKDELREIWGTPQNRREPDEPRILQAIAGLPMAISVGYEEVLEYCNAWLLALSQMGYPVENSYPIWPQLKTLREFKNSLINDYEYETPGFKDFMLERLSYMDQFSYLAQWVWELAILESNETRTRREFSGVLVFSAVYSMESPLLMFLYDKYVLYLNQEMQVIVDEFEQEQ